MSKTKKVIVEQRLLPEAAINFIWWIALIFVIGDNITYAFWKELLPSTENSVDIAGILSIFGCLSFPLFGYALIEYFYFLREHNGEKIKSVFKKMLLISIASEIIFDIIKDSTFFSFSTQNVFFTLTAAWAMLMLLNKNYKTEFFSRKKSKQRNIEKTIKFDLVMLFTLATAFLNFDYGGEGLLMIALLNYSRKRRHMKICQFVAFGLFVLMRLKLIYAIVFADLIIIYIIESLNYNKLKEKKISKSFERVMNSKSGEIAKVLFFPTQLAAIFIIKLLLSVPGK